MTLCKTYLKDFVRFQRKVTNIIYKIFKKRADPVSNDLIQAAIPQADSYAKFVKRLRMILEEDIPVKLKLDPSIIPNFEALVTKGKKR